MTKIVTDRCTVYTKPAATAAVLVAHGGQPKDGRTIPIPPGMALKYYGYEGEFKKFSRGDMIDMVEKGRLPTWVELCKWGAFVRDYEFEPYQHRDPRGNAPSEDVFWAAAQWPIILPTKNTRLSKIFKILADNNLDYPMLHCLHCRIGAESMKSWDNVGPIVS
jgi:hypothetical protein